jgi:hypothetical protein
MSYAGRSVEPSASTGAASRALLPINNAAPMLVPVAASLVKTGRPVAAPSMAMNSAFRANGPFTMVGPAAPVNRKQVLVIMAR